MDCPRCGTPLTTIAIAGGDSEAAYCEHCRFSGVTSEFESSPETAESWDEAVERFRRSAASRSDPGDAGDEPAAESLESEAAADEEGDTSASERSNEAEAEERDESGSEESDASPSPAGTEARTEDGESGWSGPEQGEESEDVESANGSADESTT